MNAGCSGTRTRAAVFAASLAVVMAIVGLVPAQASSGDLQPITRERPALVGGRLVGTTLSVDVGDYSPAHATVKIRWTGGINNNLESDEYRTSRLEVGKSLTARVEISSPGYKTSVMWVNMASPLINWVRRAEPTISGVFETGQTLTAHAGTFTPADATVTYQWISDGDWVPGATSQTYTLQPGDTESTVTARVQLSSRPGLAPSVKWAKIAPGYFSWCDPTITGGYDDGDTVTASIEPCSPTPTTVSYQWFADFEAIDGATSPSFTLRPWDRFKVISVTAIAERDGYHSSWIEEFPPGFKREPVIGPEDKARVTGEIKEGTTVTAIPPESTPDDVTLTYVWRAGHLGDVVTGETSPTMVVRGNHKTWPIRVEITAWQGGIAQFTHRAVLQPKEITRKSPSIGGQMKAGSKLTAYVGATAPSDVAASFQWYVNSNPVPGATSKYYTLRQQDMGKQIMVRVLLRKEGYAESTRYATRNS